MAPATAWLLAAALVAATAPAALTPGALHLVPPAHRPAPATFVVVHRGGADADAWARVVDGLGPQLPGHVPLAPPPVDARAWQAAHVLYWLDATSPALARRFEPDALRAAISGLRARLASPLFGLGGEDVRRDPLGLADLGTLPAPPVAATAGGDVLSADGGTLHIHLQTTAAPADIVTTANVQLSAHSSGPPFELEVHTFPRDEHSLAVTNVRSIVANLALLALALTLALRRTRESLTIVAVLAAGVPLLGFVAGPLLLVLVGAAAALTIRGEPRGSTAPWLLLVAALLPLILLPYPAWRTQALAWALAAATLALAMRFVLPATRALLRARPAEPPAPARPLPAVAALVACTAIVAAGVVALARTRVDVPAAPPVLTSLGHAATLASSGDTATAALDAAARDARTVAAALPDARLDGPARFVLDEPTLTARAAALASLDLPGRVEFFRAALTDQGFRPDAFGEFFQALDRARAPSPEAALAGPLAAWLTASMRHEDGRVVVDTRVHLPADLPAHLPAQLRGPAVFAHAEQRDFPGRLALALAAGAWLSAFLVWLSTRRLAPALASAATSATAQVGALACVVAIHGQISPLLLPALLAVGAVTAALAAGPCSGEPTRGPLAAACLAAPGLVLLTGDDPTWHAPGLALALGAALGGLLASHAAPGLAALLQPRAPRP